MSGDVITKQEFNKDVKKRYDSENKEKEDNVMAVKNVIGHIGGVIEP